MSLHDALSRPGLANITDFAFYPVGGFPSGGKVTCPSFGADKHCQLDQLEACLQGQTSAPVSQAALVSFLYCFEGQNGNAKSEASAEECALKASIDFTAAKACYADPMARASAWQAVIDDSGPSGAFDGATCLPWVVVDGKPISHGEACVEPNFGDQLATIICAAFQGEKKPAGCNGL